MKSITKRFAFLSVALSCLLLLSFNANAQLLNEVEVDPPVEIGDRCQYVEILGSSGGTVPANTYFISVNSDQDNFGFLNVAVDISGQSYGSNGTITLINTLQGVCPNRTYDSGTTIVNYSSPTSLGKGSEGFYIINSGGASLFSGQDIDSNDNGSVDLLVGGISFIDGFNFIFNPEEQFTYGPGPNLVETFLGDVPDAATRFGGNTTVNSASAWYSGELAASPEETTAYAAPLSSNFPSGGRLTPGGLDSVEPGNNARFDFDGDGKTDLGIFRPAPGEWWYRKSSDDVTVAFQFGQSSDTIVPADFTGDGKTDVAIWRETDGFWFVLRSEDFSFYAFPFGTNGDIPAPGDFDGDGSADAAVFRPSNATWYYVQSSDGANVAVQFGLNGDVPLVEDYDGDGMDDLAVYRPTTAEWYLNRSTAGFVGFQFGIPNDAAPVTADFTGDGKADVAFFQPSANQWFVLRSEDNSFFAFPFGATGDIPVPGDYDGDGTADAAVFRPSDNNWFLNQSTNGNAVVQFGIANDIPIPTAYLP